MEFPERRDSPETLDISGPRDCRVIRDRQMENSSLGREETTVCLVFRVWTDSLVLKAIVDLKEMLDRRVLQELRVRVALRERWDKEFMDQKEERERLARLDHPALPALSPRRGKEKSFSLLDSKGTRACLEERVKREC